MDDCRLITAASFAVQRLGATIIVRANGADAPAGWEARLELVEEAEPVHLRLIACPVSDDRLPRVSADIIATFALAAPPWRVLIEHDGGIAPFEVGEPPTEAAVPAQPLRGGSTTRRSLGVDARRNASARAEGPSATTPSGRPPPPPSSPPDSAGQPAATPAAPTSETTPLSSERPGFYALIDAPDKFTVDEPQPISIGISGASDPALLAAEMHVPSSVGDRFILTVQLVADGFRLSDPGGRWRHDLAVTPDQPYPSVSVSITADRIDAPLKIRRLRVLYFIEGQVIGIAERPVAVVLQSETVAAPPVLPGYAARAAMAIPVSDEPADLTVVVLHDPEGRPGRLVWAFRSRHAAVTSPATDFTTEIGSAPEEFAKRMRAEVETAEATPQQPVLRETLVEIGRRIADQMPGALWALLDAVAAQTPGKPPTVLFLSQEPYVPWELAVLPKPLDADTPNYLGAQTVIGRWVFGQDKPKMPPPDAVAMRGMSVVYGEYEHARLAKLEDALAEKAQLQAEFGAIPVRATLLAVRDLLRGQPGGEVLHFAIHGRFDSGATGGLLMEDGAALTSLAIGGFDLDAAPLVFLNACQVGSGAELLGDYAGMADAFLRAGAAAVIAPLWSVRDGVAKDVALRFYPGALRDGVTPAELLRRERARFGTQGDPSTATHLAYLFYGHPTFRLTAAS